MPDAEKSERIIDCITRDGPRTAEQLSAALHIGRDSILGAIGGLVREGRLIAQQVSKAGVRRLLPEYCLPGVKPKFDPQDPFGLVAKLRESRKQVTNV